MASSEYTYKQGGFEVSEQMKKDFDRDGFVIIRNLFDKEELDNLKKNIENEDGGLRKMAFNQDDGGGLNLTMIQWTHPGTDVSGIIARSKKVVGISDQLLGGEVYQYCATINMKEAHSGGQHLWHQDYGYWYKNGLLFPDMANMLLAVDKADKSNGCLQVLRGSHLAGRVDHKRMAGQTAADEERVDQLRKVLELVYVELDPGDVVFFHCNLLHRSDQNRSDHRRRAYIILYNRASNNPAFEHYNASYTPIDIVDDMEIKTCSNHTDFTGKQFMDLAANKNITAVRVNKD
ncbi:PHYHD1 [Branchiostoma lanceolatum]|uniref:PHYHD1 protein n=1 Tax=Branchiostoma lanceolatum TaxID=7740 RepID=A0A8K0EE46_BRALA|nr:PHYHD1 [Branchiostoma lanceolatum]